jgi:hypothetical protein
MHPIPIACPNAVKRASGEGNGPKVITGKDGDATILMVESTRKSTCKI